MPAIITAGGERLARSGIGRCINPRLTVPVRVKKVCSAKYAARLAMTPTTAALIPVSAADSAWFPRSFSTDGAPTRMNKKEGTNVAQVVIRAPSVAATHGSNSPGSRYAETNATKETTRISGPGVVSASARPTHHFGGVKPTVGVNGLLRYVGQSRISTAKGNEGRT